MRGAVADAAEQERPRRLRASEEERRVEVVERRAFLAVVGVAPAAAAAMGAEVEARAQQVWRRRGGKGAPDKQLRIPSPRLCTRVFSRLVGDFPLGRPIRDRKSKVKI